MKFNNLYQTILESLTDYKILSFNRVIHDKDSPEYHSALETYEVEIDGKIFKIVLTLINLNLKGEEDVSGIEIFDGAGKSIYSLTENDFMKKGSTDWNDKTFYKMPKRLAFLQLVINGIGNVKYGDRPQYYKLDQEVRDTWQDILPNL